MAWVIGTFKAHAILRNVLDDFDDSSGVYAIGKPPFDAKRHTRWLCSQRVISLCFLKFLFCFR
jgi:hypothetical protein